MTPGVILAALAAVVIWGASPPATKLAIADLPPLSVALLRSGIGGLLALPIALLARLPLPANGQQRWLLLLSAVGGFIAFPVLFTIGLQHSTANRGSLILASLPIFTGVVASLWYRRRPKPLFWLGCGIALLGEVVLIVMRGRGAVGLQGGIGGDLLMLGANLGASLGYVAGGTLQRQGYPSIAATFWGAALASVMLLPLMPFVIDGTSLAMVSPGAWAGIAYLAIGVTIVGYLFWYWALGHGGIERVGLFQFLQPIAGLSIAWLLLGETLEPSLIACSALILLGVWVAMRAK